MKQNDIQALAEIIRHNIPRGTRRVALINTLRSYIEAEHSHLDTAKIDSLTADYSEPPLHTIKDATFVKPTNNERERLFDPKDKSHLDRIPKVLCKLREEMGYGVTNQDNDD